VCVCVYRNAYATVLLHVWSMSEFTSKRCVRFILFPRYATTVIMPQAIIIVAQSLRTVHHSITFGNMCPYRRWSWCSASVLLVNVSHPGLMRPAIVPSWSLSAVVLLGSVIAIALLARTSRPCKQRARRARYLADCGVVSPVISQAEMLLMWFH